MLARPIDVIWKFVIGTMTDIKNKTQRALVDPLKFVTVSLPEIMPNNWALVEARENKGIIQTFLSTGRNEVFMALWHLQLLTDVANKLRHIFVKIEVTINSDTQKLHWMTDFNTFAIEIKQKTACYGGPKVSRQFKNTHGNFNLLAAISTCSR